ncbi:MAG: PSD1 and planctomycete cytochrome C domain-containing protein [Fuerstiella sp.]
MIFFNTCHSFLIRRNRPLRSALMGMLLIPHSVIATSSAADDVSFSRDILPVLSDRCFHCHGPDPSTREADLRLDLQDSAKADLGGYSAVVAGSLSKSEIWNRITSKDEDLVMPPVSSHRKPLTETEQDAIRQWITSGAKWGKHWSFEALTRPTVPATSEQPIDAFVTARLSKEGLKLSPPATAHKVLRRLTFDLTGLAPTVAEIEEFGTGSPEAWQAAVNRLLKSPRHAERMAMWWLDAARYSDSDGFQQDVTRQNWPWRDWVIEQFQQNRSFRDFTIEQFAGDLLPDATAEQKLATCFHRNHMTNGEGGRDPEESRIDYVIDRVNTTGAVWLGLTLGCVQCHSHKFDPISHHDYYSMTAFFNSIDETGSAGMKATPYLDYKSPLVEDRISQTSQFVDQVRVSEAAERKLAQQRFSKWLKQRQEVAATEHKTWWTPSPTVSSTEGTLFRVEDDQTVQTHGSTPQQDDYRIVMPIPEDMNQVTGLRIEVLPGEDHVDQKFTRSGTGDFTLTSVLAMASRAGSPSESQLEFAGAIADAEASSDRKSSWDRRYSGISKTLNDDARDGWTTEGITDITQHVAVYALEHPWQVKAGDEFVVVMRHRSTHGNANIGRFRISLAQELGETVRRTDGGSALAEFADVIKARQKVDGKLRARLLAQFLLADAVYQATAKRKKIAELQFNQLKKQAEARKVMVLAERQKPRKTHILERGVWDAKGDVVQPQVLPAVLNWPAEDTTSRLDLARWIVHKDNPLTARVIVNHVWQLMFGQGLVRTTEDFGLQGELPSHPKLLDWLAVELIENDWNLQHVIRLIAKSKTYRQSSIASAELIEQDPANRLLARAPRFRLPAWMIHDNALHVSGLLNGATGGPPVRPYQPPGVWSEITMGRFHYEPSLGPEQYRRTVYAFWRRSSAPTFLFDSAQRRVCEVGVRRTNTPLQALTLLNDITMLESSRALADAVVASTDVQSTQSQTLQWQTAVQTLAARILSRQISASETKTLNTVWTKAADYYGQHSDEAVRFCTVGQQVAPDEAKAAKTAAWMTVASLILNLDEAMTRE